MSSFTENYSLIKPSADDFYDIQDFNENMDAIDALMAEQETAAGQINDKIGNPTDVGNTTVFGLLKNGGSIVKSIQRVFYTPAQGQLTAEIDIDSVNPAKCFVLLERLKDTTEKLHYITYTLQETKLCIQNDNQNEGFLKYSFWIIEFC